MSADLGRRRFRAMGTSMEILLDAPPGAAADAALRAAEDEIRRLERVFSRFDEGSELSRLNRERAMEVSDDMLRVLGRAMRLRAGTTGLFDPTMGTEIAAHGYDRDFDLLSYAPAGRSPVRVTLRVPTARRRPPVEIDEAGRRVTLAEGFEIDLGGIAKGDAADRACAILASTGPALVSAGGDIAVTGPRADGSGWPVALEGGDGGLVVTLGAGGLATSGTDRRRWRGPEGERHHVLDPATAASAGTDLLRATVVAGTAADADAIATALLVAGSQRAPGLAEGLGVGGVLVRAEGAPLLCGALA